MSYLTTIRQNAFPPKKDQPATVKPTIHTNQSPQNQSVQNQSVQIQSIGEIHTKRYPSGQNPQSVEESGHKPPSQREKSPSRWKNPPAHTPLRVQKPPVTGTIHPPTATPAGRFLHRLEEPSRKQTVQRPNSSSRRRKQDGQTSPSGSKHPVSGGITPLH